MGRLGRCTRENVLRLCSYAGEKVGELTCQQPRLPVGSNTVNPPTGFVPVPPEVLVAFLVTLVSRKLGGCC